MKLLRILAIVATAPLWLFVGLIIVGVCIPLFITLTVISVIEYGFNGEWDPPW